MAPTVCEHVIYFPPKVHERNLTRLYIVHKTIEMATVDEFSQGESYSLSCVGLPDIALKHVAAICFLYEWINVFL